VNIGNLETHLLTDKVIGVLKLGIRHSSGSVNGYRFVHDGVSRPPAILDVFAEVYNCERPRLPNRQRLHNQNPA
jgi:hypothetical protein